MDSRQTSIEARQAFAVPQHIPGPNPRLDLWALYVSSLTIAAGARTFFHPIQQ
jgi:hypothetical protein